MSMNRRIGLKAAAALYQSMIRMLHANIGNHPHKCVMYWSLISHDIIVPKRTIYKYFTGQVLLNTRHLIVYYYIY